MKKVVIANKLKILYREKNTFLHRADIMVFTAATNDELLKIHQKTKVDLIVTELDMPGIRTEKLFDIIKKTEELRNVSTIMICKDTLDHRARCKECGANVVFLIPVDATLLQAKVQQLLTVAPRKAYRTSLAVAIQGRFKNKPLPFWTENISATGILIKASENLSKGDGIFFSFFLPNGSHVSGYGEIVRSVQPTDDPHAFLYGIKFTDIDPDVKSAIEEVLKR